MEINIPTNTPLQQQIDEFIAEGASWLPTDLLRDLLSPIGRLIMSGAAGKALKEEAQAPDFTLPAALDQSGTVRLAFVEPDFTRRLDPSVIIARLNELKGEREGSTA